MNELQKSLIRLLPEKKDILRYDNSDNLAYNTCLKEIKEILSRVELDGVLIEKILKGNWDNCDKDISKAISQQARVKE